VLNSCSFLGGAVGVTAVAGSASASRGSKACWCWSGFPHCRFPSQGGPQKFLW